MRILLNWSGRTKKALVITWLIILFLIVGSLFWYNEFVYSLPTPIPSAYVDIQLGERIDVTWEMDSTNRNPVFLHFFNPDCPCSRFNIPHFKSLVKKYGEDVRFVVVPIVLLGRQYSVKDIQDKFGFDIPVLFDPEIALACGVYSTPQAVIIDNDHTLYYRGNYNKSRYCTDKKSNYAQMALDSLLRKTVNPNFSPLALRAYGCQLPSTMCKK